MTDFYEDMDYQIPEEITPVKSEGGFDYYKHPAGIYLGFIGRLTVKYKDINGKNCDPEAMGAKPSHSVLAIWLTEYLGTSGTPKSAPILLPTSEKVQLPKDVQSAQLYFPFTLSFDPKFQWSIHQKFESFIIPGYENSRIVTVNPNRMTEKYTNFQAFKFYYGLPVKMNIELSAKGNTYVSSIKLTGGLENRIPTNLMKQLESDFEELRAREKANTNSSSEAVPSQAPPNTSVEDLENDFLG
jgi:hypothetical protein